MHTESYGDQDGGVPSFPVLLSSLLTFQGTSGRDYGHKELGDNRKISTLSF